MTSLYDPAMRDLVMAEIRQAVRDYFMPVRFVAHLIGRGVRFLPGRPNPAGTHTWWRSA